MTYPLRSATVLNVGGTSKSTSIDVVTGDVIFVYVGLNPLSITERVSGTTWDSVQLSSVVSSGFLSNFVQKFAVTAAGCSSGDCSAVWLSSAVALASGTSTVTVTLGPSNYAAYAVWNLIVAVFQGVSTVNGIQPLYDPNPNSAPLTPINDCNSVDGCGETLSTTLSPDLALFMVTSQGTPTFVQPSGWTMIASTGTLSGNGWGGSAMCYQVLNAPQSNFNTGWWTNVEESAFWGVVTVVMGESVQLIPVSINLVVAQG